MNRIEPSHCRTCALPRFGEQAARSSGEVIEHGNAAGAERGFSRRTRSRTHEHGPRADGLSRVDAYIKGVGLGRDAAVRAMQTVGINVESITDVTGVPHGGVRPKKARRV